MATPIDVVGFKFR